MLYNKNIRYIDNIICLAKTTLTFNHFKIKDRSMPRKHYYIDEPTVTDCLSNLSTEKLNIIYTGYHKDEDVFIAGEHSHNFAEILYVTSGSGKAIIEGREYKLRQGDIIVINANTIHKEISNAKDTLNLVFLAIDNFSYGDLPINHLISKDLLPVISGKSYSYKIESYFSDLLAETSTQIELSAYMVKNLVGALLALIVRLYISLGDDEHRYNQDCDSIKNYIDQNYTKPITLDSLSEQVYLSKYYLSHIFKTQTGTSPIKYMINKRIDKAANLLTSTDLTIKDIATCVGYDDPVYFSQMFKKIKGISPASFRANIPK